jgi:hypothetical protein
MRTVSRREIAGALESITRSDIGRYRKRLAGHQSLDESADDLVLKSLKAALIMAKQTGMKIRTISDLVGQRE